MVNNMWSEQELISKRNQALWRSIKNFGDPSLEDEFKETCFALSNNTLIKRKFIETVNNAQDKIVYREHVGKMMSLT